MWRLASGTGPGAPGKRESSGKAAFSHQRGIGAARCLGPRFGGRHEFPTAAHTKTTHLPALLALPGFRGILNSSGPEIGPPTRSFQGGPMISMSARLAAFAVFTAVGLSTQACKPKADAPAADSTPEAAATPAPEAVPTIVSIHCSINKSDPPQLVVDAGGEVPTGGWTNPLLTPRTYVTPPADGIWEYDFTAIRPTGMVTQVLTPIAASHTWPDYPATTLKGIRVYGVGSGVKESSLAACNQSAGSTM